MTSFDEATAVHRVVEGRYAATLDPGYGFDGTLNGGYLIATILRAAVDASPHRHPIAVSSSFLRRAQQGPAEIWVDSRKTGRTAAVSRVTLVQADQSAVEALVTTGTLAPAGPVRWSVEPPAMPPIEDCLSFDIGKPGRGFAEQVDMRFDRATMGWLDGQPTGTPEMRAYFRLREPSEHDELVLALAVDALPPVVLNTGAYGWAPTVELTSHMRAVPAPGWLTLHGRGRLVIDGWFDEDVEVWDSTGHLVAQSRQIARAGKDRRDT